MEKEEKIDDLLRTKYIHVHIQTSWDEILAKGLVSKELVGIFKQAEPVIENTHIMMHCAKLMMVKNPLPNPVGVNITPGIEPSVTTDDEQKTQYGFIMPSEFNGCYKKKLKTPKKPFNLTLAEQVGSINVQSLSQAITPIPEKMEFANTHSFVDKTLYESIVNANAQKLLKHVEDNKLATADEMKLIRSRGHTTFNTPLDPVTKYVVPTVMAKAFVAIVSEKVKEMKYQDFNTFKFILNPIGYKSWIDFHAAIKEFAEVKRSLAHLAVYELPVLEFDLEIKLKYVIWDPSKYTIVRKSDDAK